MKFTSDTTVCMIEYRSRSRERKKNIKRKIKHTNTRVYSLWAIYVLTDLKKFAESSYVFVTLQAG